MYEICEADLIFAASVKQNFQTAFLNGLGGALWNDQHLSDTNLITRQLVGGA